MRQFFTKFSQTGYDRHKMFFVFDCDAEEEFAACNGKKTRHLLPFIFQKNLDNTVVEAQKGIENLFSGELFDDESRLFSITETTRDNNILSRNRALRKPVFLECILERNNDADFENFRPLFNFLKDSVELQEQ